MVLARDPPGENALAKRSSSTAFSVFPSTGTTRKSRYATRIPAAVIDSETDM